MITVELPPLLKYLKDVLDFYMQEQHGKWGVIKAPRLVGKSIILQIMLLQSALLLNNSHSVAISPIAAQARKLYNDISRMAADLILKSNGSLLEMIFVNGSSINFYSAESGDNLRGDTIKGSGILCVDEAAYIKEDFFYTVAVPFTNVNNADIFLFSTPKFKQGLFYDLYSKGIESADKDIKSFDWTTYDLSKFLNEKTLELYRKRLPKNAFRSEYLAEFIDGDGAVFSDFKKCVAEYKIVPEYETWITIDWGTGQGLDYTVLTVGQLNAKLNKVCVEKQVYFNDLGTNDTVGQILYLLKRLVSSGCKDLVILVEKNSIGNVFFSTMKDSVEDFVEKHNELADWKNEISVRMLMFLTSNTSKERIIKSLIMCFENNDIIIPNDDKLLNELAMYECRVSPKGNPIYNAPAGFHDDTVMSLAFLVGLLYNKME